MRRSPTVRAYYERVRRGDPERNKIAIVATAHLGNFELGGFTLGVLGFPTYTVARTLDNPQLDEFLNRFRGHTGQYIIPKNGVGSGDFDLSVDAAKEMMSVEFRNVATVNADYD